MTKTENKEIINLEKPNINEFEISKIYSLINGKKLFDKVKIYLKLTKENKLKLKNYKKQIKKNINNNLICETNDDIFSIKDFNLWYNNKTKLGLENINLDIKRNKITCFIGPSGCGKSTMLRSLNRMNDLIPDLTTEGDIYFNSINIKSKKISALELRTKVGMVFQKPTPFDMSIFDNVAYGLRSHGIYNKEKLKELVIEALKDAALYDEVKDDLDMKGTSLSGGQQQRLCIARTIVMKPDVILFDEPTSALDPISTSKIEELILKLKEKYTIVLVTHSMSQAQRVSDYTAFFYKSKLVEYDTTKNIFTIPKEKLTQDYINGRF